MPTRFRLTRAIAPYLMALLTASICLKVQAIETSGVVTTPADTTSDFSLEPDVKEHEKERKDIETLLQNIENQWNAHNLDQVMANYADDYVNNDGLDKKAVSALTQDFWKTYPDAKSSSKTKSIRIEGIFATVESRDMAVGSTAKEMPGIRSRGDLNSISESKLYLKKMGSNWKIIGDRIDYEKVRVAFGLAKNLNAVFSAPEQVQSGKAFSAKLELNLPTGLAAVGSITRQELEYPQASPTDAWRPMDGTSLERIQFANSNNRNELLMATVGITSANRQHDLLGITFLTRRLNVIPNADDHTDKIITADKTSEKSADKEKEVGSKPSEKDSPAVKKAGESSGDKDNSDAKTHETP